MAEVQAGHADAAERHKEAVQQSAAVCSKILGVISQRACGAVSCSACDAKDVKIMQLQARIDVLEAARADVDAHSVLPVSRDVLDSPSPVMVATCVAHAIFQLRLPVLLTREDAEQGKGGPLFGVRVPACF